MGKLKREKQQAFLIKVSEEEEGRPTVNAGLRDLLDYSVP